MTPESTISEIEERLSKATPEPWERGDTEKLGSAHGDHTVLTQHPDFPDLPDVKTIIGDFGFGPRTVAEANANFIAHAPGDMAALLKEVTRLDAGWKAANERRVELKAALEKYGGHTRQCIEVKMNRDNQVRPCTCGFDDLNSKTPEKEDG